MTDGAELILSKSAWATYLRCHYAWYLSYALRLPSAPSLDMAAGAAVHFGAETYWRIMAGRQPYETSPEADALKAAGAALDREVASMPALDPAMAAQAAVDVQALTRTYLDKIVPTFGSPPTLIEADFLIRVDGTLVSGRIDAANEDVHDTKTTSTPSKVDSERERVAMTAYGHGYHALTGKRPGRLLLDVVAKNGKAVVKYVEPDEQGLAEVVGMVAKGINGGDFAPTGAAVGECHRCPYADGRCRFAVLS